MSFSPQNPSQHFTPKGTFELNAPGLQHDPLWYRKAVFYEVLVRGFADGNLEMVRGATHILIALAGSTGANELHALGCAMNAAAEAGDVSDQRVAVDRAAALIDQLITQAKALHAGRGHT